MLNCGELFMAVRSSWHIPILCGFSVVDEARRLKIWWHLSNEFRATRMTQGQSPVI
jgi:hypothetical protein